MISKSFPDILILRSEDGVKTQITSTEKITDEYAFTIPPNYYSNTRGSVCEVELVDFSSLGTIYSTYGFLETNLNHYNLTDTKNEEFVFLCGLGKNLLPNPRTPIKVLTQSQPTNIKMRINYGGGVALANTTHVFALKFTYFNVEDTQKEYNDVKTNTLF